MNELLSIIIVNFNSADFLGNCLRSISEQDIDVEAIVIDNGSGARERDILQSLQDEYMFLRVLFNRNNEGFSKANNRGFAVSRGEYILFLNPDTFLFPNCLERLIHFLRSNLKAGCVIPKLWMDRTRSFLLPPSYLPVLWGKIRDRLALSNNYAFAAYQNRWIKQALSFWNSDDALVVDAISGAFLMTRRNVLNAAGLFDERFPLYFEDSDLCRRMRKAGFKLYYFPHSEATHYYDQSAKGSSEAFHKFITSEKMYLEKHYGTFLVRHLSLLDRLPVKRTYYPGRTASFSSPVATPEEGYLLFSPFDTMIPCAAHRTTMAQFTFQPNFVEKLSQSLYYGMLITSHGKIYDRLVFKKQ